MGKLDGKVALVTGSNRGIGKGIALGLAAEGAGLVIAARNATTLKDVEATLQAQGTQVLAVPTDVSDEAQVEALFAKTMERFGRLDILVNNAGAFDGGPLDQLATEAWNNVIAVNLTGPFLCTRAAMRIMKQQRVGRIINIGSVSGTRVRPNSAPYAVSKHGIWGLTQSIALEGREFNISACCLNPGNTRVEPKGPRTNEREAMMDVPDLAEAAVLMATLPPHMTMLEAIVMPIQMPYIGRG